MGEEAVLQPRAKTQVSGEFEPGQIKQLFNTTEKTLVANGFGELSQTRAWMLRYCRSRTFGYIRILELEGVKKHS